MVNEVTLNLDFSDDGAIKKKTEEKIKDATKRKKQAQETMEEAWARLLGNVKLTDKDKEKLCKVKKAMNEGLVTREKDKIGRAFSKAEALRIYTQVQEIERKTKIAELIKKKPSNYILVKDKATLKMLAMEMKRADIAAFDIETFGIDKNEDALDPYKGKIAGWSLSTDRYNFYLPLNHEEKTELNLIPGLEKLAEKYVMKKLAPYFENLKLVMHNAPFDCKWIMVHYGIDLVKNLHADTRIMAFMLDENTSHRLKDLVTDWLDIESDNFDVLFGKIPFNQIPLDVAEAYAAKDTEVTLKLYKWIKSWFSKKPDLEKIGKLTFDVEMPVQRAFIYADLRGIGFDKTRAAQLDKEFAIKEQSLKRQIDNHFGKPKGEEINLSSPAQLKEVLFNELGLTDYDKGSTGVKTLKKIKSEHPVIPLILEFRELSKLRSSFTQSLPNKVQRDDKIHPWHNTLGAATGRFTCKDPNTQQIPSKHSEIRKLFTADKGRILMGADLSQIELRIAATMANEKVMIDAFNAGRDLHSTTASAASGIAYERIEEFKDTEGTPEWKWRKIAKTLNFGVLYGIGAKGLAEMLGCTSAEAQAYIDSFFEGYPEIAKFMKSNEAFILKNGFTSDMFGRKRRFHQDLKEAKEPWQKGGIIRQGNNFPVQSSAGIVLKKAICKLTEILPEMDGHILLQIHDELIFDLPETVTKEQVLLIKQTIESAVKLPVPLKSDVEIYPQRWSDAVTIDEFFGGR